MDIGKDLTKRQQEIFDFIKKYSGKHGYPPTVRDIGKAVGLALRHVAARRRRPATSMAPSTSNCRTRLRATS